MIVGEAPLGIVTIESITRRPELGFWLRQSDWGRGFMTEAAKAVVAEHFAHSDSPLVSGQLIQNAASGAVLKKLGFSYTGTLRRLSGYCGHEVEV